MFHSAQTDNGENRVNVIAQLATGRARILKRSAPRAKEAKLAPVLKTSSAFTSAFLRTRQRDSEAKARHHGKETKKKNERDKANAMLLLPVVRQMVHFLPGTNKRRKRSKRTRRRKKKPLCWKPCVYLTHRARCVLTDAPVKVATQPSPSYSSNTANHHPRVMTFIHLRFSVTEQK